jgi:hypothetical protein
MVPMNWRHKLTERGAPSQGYFHTAYFHKGYFRPPQGGRLTTWDGYFCIAALNGSLTSGISANSTLSRRPSTFSTRRM